MNHIVSRPLIKSEEEYMFDNHKVYDGEKSLLRHSEFGVLSIVIGLLGIIISVIVLYLLNQAVGPGFNQNVSIYVNLLNIFDKVEIATKVIGVLFAIIGLVQRDRKRTMSIIGVVVNTFSVFFTISITCGFL